MNSAFDICTLRNSVSVVALVTALAAPGVLFSSGAGAGTLPTNGRYIAGSGSIHGAGNGLTIDQSSTRGIIDWQSFSIGQGQTVQFDNGSGATLNEVTGNNLSQIAGSLKVTGSVYLVNPQGIIVTPTGQVITQRSFVASTRNVDSANFMAGSGIQVSGSSSGNVTNEGNISSANGDVVLFGNNARSAGNSNTDAANGTVAVIAGDSILYQPGSNSEILVKGGKGKATNHGSIRAAQAELAAAGGNVYAMAGNNGGSIQATGTSTIAGHVWLTAGGETSIAGSVAAKNANGSGGTIVATGNSVDVGNNATVSADGTTGGTVLIGGDEHGGSDPSEDLVSQYVPDAQTTNVASSATISANGTDGAGGNIVLWSQKETKFKGKVSAQGSHGAAGGNAEVSSHEVLDFKGHVNLLSPGGATGNLLLDPSNVVISTGSEDGEEEEFEVGLITFKPVAYNSVINVGTLEGALSGANVTVSTASTYSDTGDISVEDPVSWSSHTLTLDAYHSIYIASTLSASGSAGLTLKTNDGGLGGDYYFDGGYITFANTSEALTINSQKYTLVGDIATLASDIAANPADNYAIANNITAGEYSTDPIPTTFSGILAGLGNNISGLQITDTTEPNVGFFANLGSGGTIRDLTLVNPIVESPSGAAQLEGALVAESLGTLSDDSIIASAPDYPIVSSGAADLGAIGGLVGWGVGIIENCSVGIGTQISYNYSLNSSSSIDAGGLVGHFGNGTISNSNANAQISIEAAIPSAFHIGGLVGYDYSDDSGSSSVTQSYSTATVSAGAHDESTLDVGGLIGLQSGTEVSVSNSYSSADVSAADGSGSNAGGLIGEESGGSVSGSYATGSVSTNNSLDDPVYFNGNVGGLIGYLTSEGTVTSSYATGDVGVGSSTNTGGNEGGLVGWVDQGTSISTSYASGSVSGYGSLVGGLVGRNDGSISTSSAIQSGTGPLISSNASDGSVGGLVGQNNSDGTISESFSAPNETSTTNPAISGAGLSFVGGLVGTNEGSIANSYSLPTASGSQVLIVGGASSDIGGLIGYDFNPGSLSLQLSSSYSTGSVSGGSGSYAGGLIGYDASGNNTMQIFENVYWDTSTSNVTGSSQGAGNIANDPGLSAETSSGLISQVGSGLSSPPWYSVPGVNNDGSGNYLPCLTAVTGGCGD